MTQRAILEMARQTVPPAWLDDRCKYLEEFAKLVAEHEREECAKVCEQGEFMTFGCAAQAIRKRGNQ